MRNKTNRLIAAALVIMAELLWTGSAHAANSTTVGPLNLLSTFHSISVKALFSDDDNANGIVVVQFRRSGTTEWLKAYSPYIDRRAMLASRANPYANQARGSIVGLAPNTSYDVQVTWTDADGVRGTNPVTAAVSTLSYTPPTGGSAITVNNDAQLTSALNTVAPGQTIHMNPGTYSPFGVTRSGNSGAWIVVEGDSAGSTIVSTGNGSTVPRACGGFCGISVNANFVVIRQLTLPSSDWSGIRLQPNINHVFVESNTISNVSAQCASNPAAHYGDGGISVGDGSSDIYLLDNAIGSRALNAGNNPGDMFPSGCTLRPIYDSPAVGIQWAGCIPASRGCAGPVTTLVVENNVVTGGFRDGISSDSDGNVAENVDVDGNTVKDGYKDDPIEHKGGNLNIRIWDNHVVANGLYSATCVALNTRGDQYSFGPLYFFRNTCFVTSAQSSGETIFKIGGAPTFIFHNSIDASGSPRRWDGFVSGGGATITALNNIVKLPGNSIAYGKTSDVFDYNLYRNTNPTDVNFARQWNATTTYSKFAAFQTGTGQEAHGFCGSVSTGCIRGYDPNFSDNSLHIGRTSPAVDRGVIIPNFNDAASSWPFSGAAPDLGAFELPAR
jgi:hypothetical protein